MSKVPYYKVSTSPKRLRKPPEKTGFIKNKRRRQMIMAVIGVYLVAGGLLGLFIFNTANRDLAEASQAAAISTSLRFVEEKNFSVGDQVEVILTMQNTSVVESINEINIDILSTRESVKWNKAVNRTTGNVIPIQLSGNFEFPSLTFGERAEYLIYGTYQESSLDFLTILGRVKFRNTLGLQTVDTNRIYTNLDPSRLSGNQPLNLSLAKTEFVPGENISLSLTSPIEGSALPSGLSGKIFVNKRFSNEVVASFDCAPQETGACQANVDNLGPGEYSSIFIPDKGQDYSSIVWFSVAGAAARNSLVPSEQAALILPFGSKSVNGIIPVIAQRVISQNQSPDNTPPCVFEIILGGQVALRQTAPVLDDRSCQTEFSSGQLGGDGIYRIKLANSGLEADVSFLSKTPGLLTLTNPSGVAGKNQPLTVRSSEIKDNEGNPVKNDPLTLSIFYKSSGDIQQLTSINGERLAIKEGVFETTIPGSLFTSSGTYYVFFESTSGRSSDFLVITITDSNLGFTESGVIIEDYSKLRIGEQISVKVNGVTDKNGQPVATGSCLVNIFATNSAGVPLAIDGQIRDGICGLTIPAGRITKSGPYLLSFSGSNNESSLNQSKQIQIAPGIANNFGKIALEYEPAMKNFANKAIIGPVVDQFGNPTNSFNNILQIQNQEGLPVKDLTEVNITNGYAEVLIPSSLISEDKLILKLLDTSANELASREITVIPASETLILPSMPTQISNDQPLDIATKYTGEGTIDNCTFRFIKNNLEFIEEIVSYNFEKEVCELKWNVNQFRDAEKVLVQILVGDKEYHHLVALKPSSPANLFGIKPEVRFNKQKEIQIALLTSPIVDQFGMPVTSGEVRWQYNGKIESSPIVNGFARLELVASKLESRDVRVNLDERYLDLDLNVQAGPASVSNTNNVSIFLGNYDISSNLEKFEIKGGSTYVSSQHPKIFKFETEFCQAYILSSTFDFQNILTHKQGNICYVQVVGSAGKNSIVFETNGFTTGKFNFTSGPGFQDVHWCANEGDKCRLIKVNAPTTSNIEAVIYDGDNQYKFTGEELENIVAISQNGLNPLKEYLVEVYYKDLEGNQISHYETILGERLIQ